MTIRVFKDNHIRGEIFADSKLGVEFYDLLSAAVIPSTDDTDNDETE